MFAAVTACVLNIILNYLLVPQFGIEGSAYGTLLSTFLISVSYIYYSGFYKTLNYLNYFYGILLISLLYFTFSISDIPITIVKTTIFIYFLYTTIAHIKKILVAN